jgi:hypothetical protein
MPGKFLSKAMVMKTVVLLLLGITACTGGMSLKVGWVEQSGFNHTTASYSTFSGAQRRQVEVAAGQTLTLNFDVTVNKGTLTLRILDPDNNIEWERAFSSNDAGLVEVYVDSGGAYQIAIIGEQTGGSFDLNWQVQ